MIVGPFACFDLSSSSCCARPYDSVEMLMRVYATCMTGLEDVWTSRMDGTLHLEDAGRAQDRGEGQP